MDLDRLNLAIDAGIFEDSEATTIRELLRDELQVLINRNPEKIPLHDLCRNGGRADLSEGFDLSVREFQFSAEKIDVLIDVYFNEIVSDFATGHEEVVPHAESLGVTIDRLAGGAIFRRQRSRVSEK